MPDPFGLNWWRNPSRSKIASSRKRGERWFSAQELDILTAQARSLREAGKRNDEIANILHISYATVVRLIGKMPKELCRPRGGRRARLTDAEREQRRAERQQATYTAFKREDDLDLLRRRLAAYAQAELHASTNEALMHDPSDIVAAVEAELGGVVEWNGHGLRRRAIDSDEVEWRDEAEEEWPEPKSAHYYAVYRRMVLEERRCAAQAARLGQPKFMRTPIGYAPPLDEC